MRHQLKSKTPSAVARLRYIIREGRYAAGLDGPRNDLRAMGSANLPTWADGNAAVFWAAADGYERANARRCLELELNLPRELNTRQQVAAVEDYIARLSAKAGLMPCTWAIHNAGDGNPHVHLMIQERPLDGHERTAETWFKRANRAAPEKGGAIKSTWWHDREHVFWSRALWADACNQALTQGGHEARFDARRKAVRLDDALRAGDLRAAALLTTVTERHEGHAVAGMRRRYDNCEVELDDLPDYAQQIIQHNDRARAHNNGLRDWVRSASDAELREYLAVPLAELRERLEAESPSTHVTAWEAAQHVQALDEDRVRSVASAQQAGELELLAAAQIEAAERTAIAAELGELIEQEQGDHLGDLLAIEREQAHGAAVELAELAADEMIDVARQRLAIERAQAHSAALVEDAERERRATILHALGEWQRYLGDRPESAEVIAAAAQVRAGEPVAVEQAERLAWSLRAAEQQRAEQAKRERQEAQRRAELEALRQQRVAAMEAEREQQRQAERELLTSFARQPDTPKTRAPEPRGGGDQWVEFERDGERYRHPNGRPDELYWQNPAGEWHLQPDEPDQPDYDGYDYR